MDPPPRLSEAHPMMATLKRMFTLADHAELQNTDRFATVRLEALVERGLDSPHTISVEEVQELCGCLLRYMAARAPDPRLPAEER